MSKVKKSLNAAKPVSLLHWQAECPADWPSDPRAVTVLRTLNIPATKEYKYNDNTGRYEKVPPRQLPDGKALHAKRYHVRVALPKGIRELAAVLQEAAQDHCNLVVRGYVVNTLKTRKQWVFRDQQTIHDTPRHWVMLDLDGFPLPIEFNWLDNLGRTAKWAVDAYLPAFAGAAFVYQFSASAGVKPGLRLHLWFWLETPADSAALNKHFQNTATDLLGYKDADAGIEASFDIGVLEQIQEHFIANPIISGPDPLNGQARLGFVEASRMTLVLAESSAAPSPSDNPAIADIRFTDETLGWQPKLEDVAGMVPHVIAVYPKLVEDHESKGEKWWQHPWRRCINALKHHLIQVLGMTDADAYKWVDENFSKLLPKYDADDNLKRWGDLRIDLAPERQVKINTFIYYAETDPTYKLPAEALSAKQQRRIEAVEDQWVYFDALKLFYRFDTDDKWDHKQIDNSLPRVFLPNKDPEKPPKVVSMSEYLLHRASAFKKLHSPAYLPGSGERILTVNRRSGSVKVMNLWTDGDIIAAPGDHRPFLDHVAYLIPDPVERHLFLASLAWTVKRSGKLMFAILWQGIPGTGKSWVVSVVQMILGILNCREVEVDEVTSDFNDWLEAVELVVVNEIRDLTSDKRGLMNKFKSLITQPEVRINAKHQKRYAMPTPRIFICMTNETDPIYIDNEDRRWFVLASPAVPQSAYYYDELFAYSGDLEQVKTGRLLTPEQRANLGAIKHFLERYPMQMDIAVNGVVQHVRFNGRGRAPETEGRKELVDISLSDSARWVRDAIQNRQWPFTADVVNTQAIVGEPGNLPLNLRSISARKLGLDLRKAGAVQIGNMKIPGTDELVRCWAIRNIEQWRSASDKARGAHWKNYADLARDIEAGMKIDDDIVMQGIQAAKRAYSKARDGKPM